MTNNNDNPFASEFTSRSIAGPIIKTLAMVCVCCTAAYGVHLLSRHWLIERLSFGLEEHPPQVQSERLAMLAEFGAAGLPTLVDSICADSNSLSQNAYRTVVELQGRWTSGAAGDAPKMNLALVSAIDNSAPTCPPARRGLLAGLLNQCILETVDSTHHKDKQAYQLSQRLLTVLAPNNSGSSIANGYMGNRSLRLSGDVSTQDDGLLLASSPGDSGRLLPPLPTQLLSVTAPGADENLDELGPDWVSVDEGQTRATLMTTESGKFATANPLILDRRQPAEPIDNITDNPLANYDDRSVIDFLASPQPSLVKAAEAELRRRSLSEAEIMLAYRLVSADPEVRLSLVNELPSRSDVAPQTWLLWLSTDFERQVRLQAISILGSMDDPAIQKALRERLRDERDMIVASRIRKVLGLR